ncbi:DUF418 domain-containing protein [candidate division KSB1 bacterium]|nr:DUF418 domain-containing protein [candidate division KSB1 bacterium]MBL7094428.1 DUF418 domain-containing protein [candidate division KSB1 bacterium]
MTQENNLLSPVSITQRIISLDVLRGFAVLGILIMNIQSFSMIGAAYLNPDAFGDLTGLNKWVWILSHIFADLKFMTIFSILFGAGIILFTNRVAEKGYSQAKLHYRRTFWLLVIGLMHAYLLWYGDILVIYALCALFIYLFRNLSPMKLFVIGIILISVASMLYLMSGLSMQFWPPEAIENTLKGWRPNDELVQSEVLAYQGGWLGQMSKRIPSALALQTFLFLFLFGWRAGGLMLVGMALYKWGVLKAERTKRFYTISIGIGFGIGLPLIIYGIVRNFAAGWILGYSMFIGSQYNYWGSLLIAFAYVSLIMLFCLSQIGEKIKSLFAAVGRMAFTNYLLQTIICTTIFYGHGFGHYGEVERSTQILIVLCVWIFQLIISPIWLRFFKFGPFEWLWRSLTYWKIQSMSVK